MIRWSSSSRWFGMGSILGLTGFAALPACGELGSSAGDGPLGASQAALTTSDVFGFESLSGWSTTTPGAALSLSTTHSQGATSLQVKPSNSNGYTPLASVALSTLDSVSNTLSFDVMLPTQQPNPGWYGDAQVYLNCPSRNIFSAFLAQVALTGKPLNVWNTLSFPLTNSEITSLLSAGYADLTITVVLNVPVPTTGVYRVDNLRFTPAASCGGRPNGTACNDGNACTQTDTCQAGSCVGTNPKVCGASDQCHVAGTCAPATGLCSNPVSPNGTACSDGNACTTSDTCQSGTCQGGPAKVCTAIDACHDAGVCSPATGCSTPAKPDGTSCNDNNSCTSYDTCQAGSCAGSNASSCRWTKVGEQFPGSGPIHVQLLMDGSVLAGDSGSPANWYRFTPDPTAGYAGGHWTTAPAQTHYQRRYFGTGMLKDGRYVIGGGEYVNQRDGTPVDATTGRSHFEIYDPNTNTWSDLPDFANTTQYADGVSAPLPDGRVLFGPAYVSTGGSSSESMLFDPSQPSAPWTTARTIDCYGPFREGSMVQLQNGNVLAVGYRTETAVFSSANSSWSACTAWPGDPAKNPYASDDEGGPALLLYSGKVFISGATGYNAVYNPSDGSIASVASTPGLEKMFENDQIVLPTGKVLAATTRDFLAYDFYEYDAGSDSFADVTAGQPDFHTINGNLLATPLPDGTALVANAGFKDIYLYTPVGLQQTQYGQPAISGVTGPVGGVYTLTGTGLNGLTNGAARDDEGHNYTSFPVVSVSASGQTRYCPVVAVSSMSVTPGAPGSVQFKLPTDLPAHGTLTVRVSASGLASSNSVTLTY
jgi:hypothetical protein